MRWLGRSLFAAAAALAERGRLIPSLGIGAGLLVVLSLPAPPPICPSPLGDEEVDVQPVAVADTVVETLPEVAQVERILARRTNGIGLEVREQLADAVVAEAEAAHLDPLFVLAVMRVESEFVEDATSVRGARGLMQIRPTTLGFMAQREGIRLPPDEIVRDPVLTARLAIRYLGRLTTAFKGNLDLALMAYNAGPHRVNTALIQGDDLGSLTGYPRAVRRAWQQLLNRPTTDDLAVAELRSPRSTDGE